MMAGLAPPYFNSTSERGLHNSTLVARLLQACSTNWQKMAKTRLQHGKPGYKINLIPTDFVKWCAQAHFFHVLRKLTNNFFLVSLSVSIILWIKNIGIFFPEKMLQGLQNRRSNCIALFVQIFPSE